MKASPKSLLVLLLAALAGASPAVGQQQEGTAGEGALFLLLPVGAEAVSLGRAMTAMEGSEGAFWNPAGLVGVPRSELLIVLPASVFLRYKTTFDRFSSRIL